MINEVKHVLYINYLHLDLYGLKELEAYIGTASGLCKL